MNSIHDLINGNKIFVKEKLQKDFNFITNPLKDQIHRWLFDLRITFINDYNVSFHKTLPIPKVFKLDSKIVAE